jgi:hypothetical protein
MPFLASNESEQTRVEGDDSTEDRPSDGLILDDVLRGEEVAAPVRERDDCISTTLEIYLHTIVEVVQRVYKVRRISQNLFNLLGFPHKKRTLFRSQVVRRRRRCGINHFRDWLHELIMS